MIRTDGQPLPDLALKVQDALARAEKLESRLSGDILKMVGMSGRKYRCFINNLVGAMPSPAYLEIGVWAGSTLCAAVAGNTVVATAIDDWSEFGGPGEIFFLNVGRFKGPRARVSFLDRNFRTVDFRTLGQHNVYLFDGPHEEADQFDGVMLAQPALAVEHVLIVDDWNYEAVRTGTWRAIRTLGLRVRFWVEIRTTTDNTHPAISGADSDWHNGYFIGVLEQHPRAAV